ncbi:MAG: transcriptional regulator [Lacipirellulaceae bacterium]
MADMLPTPSTATTTSISDLPSDLQHLAAAIAALPAEHVADLQPLLDRVVESTGRRRRILTLVQEALGQLRLDMKYLMFDLEATRRERDSYREQVDHLTGDAD